VDNTTGEATATVDDTTDAVDETVNETDDATDAPDGATETVDDTTDAVDETTGTVEETTDGVTDGVDETVAGTVTTTPIDDGGSTTATPDGEDRPAWLDQVDDDEAVLRTVEETEGGLDDVSNVRSETEPLSEQTITADENLTRLYNWTVLLLNGPDPADVEWASDLLPEPNASTVGTETVTTTPTETEASGSDPDDGGILGGATD
jgi:hypothetical protein